MGLGRLVPAPGEPGKENGWAYGQERTDRHHAHRRSNGEVGHGNEMTANAVKEHAIVVRRPEVVRDPAHKPAIDEGLVKDVNDIRRKKDPEEQA